MTQNQATCRQGISKGSNGASKTTPQKGARCSSGIRGQIRKLARRCNHQVLRDLKPRNMFVVSQSRRWWVKIGDFGITKRCDLQHIAQTAPFPTRRSKSLPFTKELLKGKVERTGMDFWRPCLCWIRHNAQRQKLRPKLLGSKS